MDSLISGNLHDAELVAVAIARDSWKVRLDFRLESGIQRSVQLDGVVAFRSEDLILQNVVSRVLRSSLGDLSRESLDHWLTWVTSLSDAHSWLSGQHKSELFADCESGALELVVFEPSAGAQVVALCKRFAIT